ncbi:MAG: hypothetical protein IH905_10785, partial [Proteobacteria bacterium]|nr:hypothetical protein [Pseudomonadota bacterium]
KLKLAILGLRRDSFFEDASIAGALEILLLGTPVSPFRGLTNQLRESASDVAKQMPGLATHLLEKGLLQRKPNRVQLAIIQGLVANLCADEIATTCKELGATQVLLLLGLNPTLLARRKFWDAVDSGYFKSVLSEGLKGDRGAEVYPALSDIIWAAASSKHRARGAGAQKIK